MNREFWERRVKIRGDKPVDQRQLEALEEIGDQLVVIADALTRIADNSGGFGQYSPATPDDDD